LYYRVKYINDKREGLFESYYESGELYVEINVEINYIDDRKNGFCRIYNSNEEIHYEVNYIDDNII